MLMVIISRRLKHLRGFVLQFYPVPACRSSSSLSTFRDIRWCTGRPQRALSSVWNGRCLRFEPWGRTAQLSPSSRRAWPMSSKSDLSSTSSKAPTVTSKWPRPWRKVRRASSRLTVCSLKRNVPQFLSHSLHRSHITMWCVYLYIYIYIYTELGCNWLNVIWIT